MLKIKLSRQGKKKHPLYRLVITEVGRDPYGDNLEILGFYNPHTKVLEAKTDRIKYWLSQGAQLTPTINNLLVDKKVIEGKKVAVSKLTKKSREATAKKATDAKAAEAKAVEDKKAADAAAAEAVDEPKEAAVAPVAEPEIPAEEAKTEETPA